MMENRLSKRELLDWINVVSFAVDDVKLFLDTHPYDEEALLYFDEFKKQRVQAMKEYAKNYGPVADGNGRWNHGHGRKGDVNRCGIMRNGYSIRYGSQRLIRRSHRSLSHSLEVRTESWLPPCVTCHSVTRCRIGKLQEH